MIVVEDIVEDGPVFNEGRLLLEQSDGDIFMYPDRALVGGVFSREYSQQGRFAAAVARDESDLISFFDMEADFAEQRLDAVGFTQTFDGDIMHAAKIQSVCCKDTAGAQNPGHECLILSRIPNRHGREPLRLR